MAEIIREIQTTKKDTKECQCTFPECNVICVVNVFYAPYKARCSAHKGKTHRDVLSATVTTATAVQAKDAIPNGALANLLCPICHSMLTIDQATSKGQFITFVCAKPGQCGTVVTVQLNWAWAVVKVIPDAWKPLVEFHNQHVKQYYKDLKDEQTTAVA